MWLVSAWPVAGSLPFELQPGDYTIGRSPEHAIVIYDSSISRIHARLRVSERREVTIEDLGSRNGVEVNGKLA
ncbi:MAG: FHA domain-containing protein, partial [Planctomycetales bacterium]|nr:FHA domain-containing protein [Planctomycetales bacterium]